MADDSDYIVKLAVWLGRALGRGASLFSEFSTESLGTKLPDSVVKSPSVNSALKNTESAAQDLETASDDLENAAGSSNEIQLISDFVSFGTALQKYFSSISSLVDKVGSAITTGTIADASERAAAEALVTILTKKLSDFLTISAIAQANPRLAYMLRLAGLIEWSYLPAEAGHSLSRDYVKKSLHLERLKDLISGPAQHFRDALGWGTATFNPKDFFQIYAQFFDEEDAITVGEIGGDPFLEYGRLRIRLVSSQSPPALQLDFSAAVQGREKVRFDISEKWGIGLSADLAFSGGASALISAPLSVTLLPATAETVSGQLRLFANRNENARPFDILTAGALNLTANDTSLGIGLKADWDANSGTASIKPLIFSEMSRATIKLGTSDSDSFISKLLSNADVKGQFDLGLEWQADVGLRIKASGGIEIAIPMHLSLGIVEFNTLYIAVTIENDGTLSLETSASLTGLLGPLSASVERMGTQLDLRLTDDTSARFGFFDLDLAFKPPHGVGLALDAGAVKGGGYLFFDSDREEYAGALELVFSEWIALKAVGLITTKLPDGSKGFSLIIIITAEFTIQLGYGFVFLGAGGLLGLYRTMKLQPLAEGVRTGATANILFPTNIVENAPRIISDIRIFFPVEKDKFLIGPMVKLGWGTPTLISISLGIVIEIRINEGGGIERIAILGVLKCILPDEEAALLVLQVNFIGAIDFEKKTAFFFTSIFESRVLFITIEGEMGVLVAWGDDSNFLVSVGGFHPRFSPPPLPFPLPKRVSLNILNKSWGKIRVEGYFAVTTNTAQFGAKLELYFGFSALRIEGHVAFDALFQFDPFYFIIEISGKVSLKVFGIGLFSISLKFSLEGPTPWHAKGYGKIKILFFSIKARFDKTWGSSQNTTLPPIKVLPILEKELLNIQNWQAIIPDSNNLLVSLRKLDDSTASSTEEIALHPVGILRISQRAVPLKIKLDKIGNQKPEDANRFEVEVSGALTKKRDYKESFARAQFQDLKDSKKLSSPAYEKEIGGLELSATGKQFRSGRMTVRHVRYELITIDTAYKRFKVKFFSWLQVLFGHYFMNNAASLSQLSFRTKQELQPFVDKIDVFPDDYAVAFNKDNKPFTASTSEYTSQASAEAFMAEEISKNPQMADDLHVIPCSEVNLAA